jgi:phospholipid N-methyltransferase
MKTEYDVLKILYDYFDHVIVNALLDGAIYLKKRPSNSNKKDLVISCLPIISGDTQRIIVFLNVFAEDFHENGLPQYSFFDSIAKALIDRIEDYDKTRGEFLSMEIIDQGVVNDNERKNTSYCSIRLLCYIEE